MLVSQVLKKKGNQVVTIQPAATIKDVADKLAELNFGALVVSDNGSSVDGIISERDIVRSLARDGVKCLDSAVSDLMVSSVITCGPEANIEHVMATMTDGHFRHMPIVVDAAMVGLVSIGDIVNARLDELEDERQHLTNYISGR